MNSTTPCLRTVIERPRIGSLRHTLTVLALAAAAMAAQGRPAHAAKANFALLINGDSAYSHTHNIEIAIEALTKLGYARTNILVAADSREVRSEIRDLASRLGGDDTLLVYTTGHGSRKGNESRLYLRSGDVGAVEFSHLIDGLKFGRLIYVGDQCYSGGFATALAARGRNLVAVTATDDTHQARCEPFVRPLWRAAVDDGATIEAAYEIASRSAKQALDGSPESATRYVTSGASVGHQNSFAS
ncbi:MAG: hypothetical protein ABI609_02185 [Acidobacteriota bacterium]